MSQQTYPIPTSNPHAHLVVTFFLLWLVNALIITVANALFPNNIVLGTMSLSHFTALILSSGVLAWAATITLPLFTAIEIRQQMVLTPQHWMAGYLVINAISLWIVSRFAEALGLGISSWVFVLGLAAVLDILQGMTMMAYGQATKRNEQ